MRSSAHRIPDFSVLLSGRVLITTSLQAQAVVVGWHVYELTKDPLLLGLIGLCEAIPAILFAFMSGHVVDNRRPAAVYLWCTLILFVNGLVLWLAALPALHIPATTHLLLLFSVVFVSGMVRSFSSPATFALISHIVPRADLPSASAWSSTAFQSAAILGPAFAGLVYGAFGAPSAFAIGPICMSLAVLTAFRFSPSTRSMRSPSHREPFLQSVMTGIRFAYDQKLLLSSMTLDMFSVLFGGAVAILPMFSDQVLHAGSFGVGLLRASPPLGSALVAIFLAVKPLQVISGRMFLSVVTGFGLSIIGFAFCTNFYLAMFCLMLSGLFDGVSLVIRNTLLQMLTPANMRGRVSSLNLIFITSSNEIGAFESGVSARVLGLIPSIVFGGVMTLMVVATTSWASPELRKARLRPGE